ncbi:MAG: hypothetical protein V5A61_17370 [Haloarculaceae archaeon]|jgi:hypothetical protein
MTDPSSLRDSTQIVLDHGVLDGVREEIEAEFTVTVHEAERTVRIIGSPVEIKAVTRFLARNGVSLP